MPFGHFGDGNVHYNAHAAAGDGARPATSTCGSRCRKCWCHAVVVSLNGSDLRGTRHRPYESVKQLVHVFKMRRRDGPDVRRIKKRVGSAGDIPEPWQGRVGKRLFRRATSEIWIVPAPTRSCPGFSARAWGFAPSEGFVGRAGKAPHKARRIVNQLDLATDAHFAPATSEPSCRSRGAPASRRPGRRFQPLADLQFALYKGPSDIDVAFCARTATVLPGVGGQTRAEPCRSTELPAASTSKPTAPRCWILFGPSGRQGPPTGRARLQRYRCLFHSLCTEQIVVGGQRLDASIRRTTPCLARSLPHGTCGSAAVHAPHDDDRIDCTCVYDGRSFTTTDRGGDLVVMSDGQRIDLDTLDGVPLRVESLFDFAMMHATQRPNDASSSTRTLGYPAAHRRRPRPRRSPARTIGPSRCSASPLP